MDRLKVIEEIEECVYDISDCLRIEFPVFVDPIMTNIVWGIDRGNYAHGMYYDHIKKEPSWIIRLHKKERGYSLYFVNEKNKIFLLHCGIRKELEQLDDSSLEYCHSWLLECKKDVEQNFPEYW